LEIHLARGIDLAAALILHLKVVRGILRTGRSPAQYDYALAPLRKAQARMGCLRASGAEANLARNVYLEKFRERTRTEQPLRFAAKVSLQMDLGLGAVRRCATQLEATFAGDLTAALRDANLAYHHFSKGLSELMRMKAWAVGFENTAASTAGTGRR
jgi:hypothetical protein